VQSRRDLFQAHRLMTQRASLALLRGEPDIPDQPLRRLNVATFTGVLVAVIVMALFLIWGLLGHGGSSLQDQPGTLIIDKQTGQAYVFCRGRLVCPVVNYASARLALRSQAVTQQTVSQAALSKFARGPLIGIPGLPQPLPEASLLVRQPWSVCTRTAVGLAGQQTTTTLAGGIQTGGTPLGGRALLATALGQDWVVWDAQRMLIQRDLLSALPASPQPVSVPSVWLAALPQGPNFAPPPVPDQGALVPGPTGVPVHVGQTYQATLAGITHYYVMLRDGLAPISQAQVTLLASMPDAPKTVLLANSQVTGHTSASTVPAGGLPATMPAFATPSSSAPWCVVYAGPGRQLTRQVETGGQVPAGGAPTGIPGDVDQVALPPGKGALVGVGPGHPVSYFLVAGGRRYALASTEVAGMLGYNLSQAEPLPAGVVDLIPPGPALDPAQATKTVPPGG